MRDAGLVGAGIVFGRLTSKTWSDPRCQLGLVVFLVATAVLTLASFSQSSVTENIPTALGVKQRRSFLNEMRKKGELLGLAAAQ